MDLAVANNISEGKVSIFIAGDEGAFDEPVDYEVSSFPGSLVPFYFNQDGLVDLATVSSDRISILAGNGDGTFDSAVQVETGLDASFQPESLETGDFNGDSFPDLIAPLDSGNISVMLANGDDSFQELEVVTDADSISSLSLGDFDDDGNLDFVSLSESDNVFRPFCFFWCRRRFVSGCL